MITTAAVAAMSAMSLFLCFFLLFREACKALAFWEVVEPIIARHKWVKLLKNEVAAVNGMCDGSVTPAPPHSLF